ncbi:MAG: cytochrome P450, partial [Pseudomonadota bacterium]
MSELPPKPPARPEQASLWHRLRLARKDFLRAQPARLYGAWMAQQSALFYQSYLVNDPTIVAQIPESDEAQFPKSQIVARGLRPLLGRSVFVTSGAEWARARALIDPAFAQGRLRESFPAMAAASKAMLARLDTGGTVEIEAHMSHATADVMMRTLFSLPITDASARGVYEAFQAYQRAQPLLSPLSLLRFPGLGAQKGKVEARRIRDLLDELIARRRATLAAGNAPNDLATQLMTARDDAGQGFTDTEMADQVAIFFLAGHETSASALAWAFYLLATHPGAQERVAAERQALGSGSLSFAQLRGLPFTRNVVRETLRLYPPVPMMLRDVARPQRWRDRAIRPGALAILAPWYLHRHTKLWDNPDGFDPDRWASEGPKGAYIPFSKGPRVCTGAGFAMMEAVLMVSDLVSAFELRPVGAGPGPVSPITIRAQAGLT